MLEALQKLINADLYRYGGITKEAELSFMGRKELYGYQYTKVLRKCRFYKDHNAKLRFYYYRLWLAKLSLKYGFQISYATDIGPGLYLGHSGSIVVNSLAKIGKNVNLAQGVTIGLANGGQHPGVPVIGDNVWIGANATVVGGISIGNDVMIAPNTFVNFDVPDHSIVVAQRAEIIHRNPATEKYVENLAE